MNTLVALAVMTIGQIFVVNPQIPVVQYRSTVSYVNTVQVSYPIYTPYYQYQPTAVLYSSPYGLSPFPYYGNFTMQYPYTYSYPLYRIYPWGQ